MPIDDFRETLSRVPTAVTIVTTLKDSHPHGTTVSAFCSLSAEPPLVMVALDRSSDLLQLLQEVGRFAVNLLAAGQEEVGRACARKGPGKLADVPWRDEGGLPRLERAAAFLSCDVEQVVPGGDHLVVIGRVTACDTDEFQPLVYHRRRFLELAS